MKKKLISLLLVATMAVGLVACGSDAASDSTNNAGGTETADAATPAATGDKELAVQIGPDPETIDPALNSAVDGGNMLLHAFECC